MLAQVGVGLELRLGQPPVIVLIVLFNSLSNSGIHGSEAAGVEIGTVSPLAMGVPRPPARPRASTVAAGRSPGRTRPGAPTPARRVARVDRRPDTMGVAHPRVTRAARSSRARDRWGVGGEHEGACRLIADQDDRALGQDRRGGHPVEVPERAQRVAPGFRAVVRIGDKSEVREEPDHARFVGHGHRRRRMVGGVNLVCPRARDRRRHTSLPVFASRLIGTSWSPSLAVRTRIRRLSPRATTALSGIAVFQTTFFDGENSDRITTVSPTPDPLGPRKLPLVHGMTSAHEDERQTKSLIDAHGHS